MDDIRHSVNNEHEVKALMSDVDDAFEAGGHHVKQWISNAQTDAKEQGEVVLGGQSHTEKVLGRVWLPQENLIG